MEIFKVNSENAPLFIEYCKRHRDGLDDTYLLDEELADFVPDETNPSYLAIEGKETVGAVSLKMDDYLLRGRKGRFRILHSKNDSAAVYTELFSAAKKDFPSDLIDRVILFVMEKDIALRENLKLLGFKTERFSYLLTREHIPVGDHALGPEYSYRAFVPGRDEADYCHIRNVAFANLAGSETPLTPEEAAKMAAKDDYIVNGILFLCHEEKPVGIVRVAREFYNGNHYALIGPIALLPEYQKKGLGRRLLRAGLKTGENSGFTQSILSVNAENEQAAKLYWSEGFETVESFVCYQYLLK